MKITAPKIGLLLAFLSLSACEVDRFPETQISDVSFWKTETDLKTAANYLYTFLPGFAIEEDWSDNAFGTQADPISDGSRLAPATSADYATPYQLIRAANNILEKAPQAAVTPAVLNRYLAEARFFRAFAYFQLAERYGGVPLILKTLTENASELTQPAAPRADVFAQIYQDLDFAAATLSTPTALGATDYGRISNTAALALKARVALFEGTRSKFHQYGDATQHLTLAIAAAKAVMDSKQHDLYASYADLFQYAGEGRQNRENILVKQYGVSSGNVVLSHNYSLDLYVGGVNPTKSLVDSYLLTDGLPIEKSPLYVAPATSQGVFQNRDKRLAATVFRQGEAYNTGATFTTPLQYHKTGFGSKKYFSAQDYTTRQALVDRVLLRYAEVLLTYAEAQYELNGAISDADLDLTINRLRTRAGVARLSNQFVGANGLSMREEIRRERRVELALENLRYWDLIRWKTAEVELPKAVRGNYFFKQEFGTTTPVQVDANGYIVAQAASFRRFNPTRDYLWPFPINELSLNPALEQNSGW